MTSDEQEAESIKYGNTGIMILPLRSGNFAIFNRGFQFRMIVPVVTNDILLSIPPANPLVEHPSTPRAHPKRRVVVEADRDTSFDLSGF